MLATLAAGSVLSVRTPLALSVAARAPLLLCLGGLIASCDNFATKAATAQRAAADEALALVFPDTSPRGDGVPELVPDDAGLLSAFGLKEARIERIASRLKRSHCDSNSLSASGFNDGVQASSAAGAAGSLAGAAAGAEALVTAAAGAASPARPH